MNAYQHESDLYGVPNLTVASGGAGVSQNLFLFQGGIQDRIAGWVKAGARWYNPATGRWTQQDPLDNPLDPNNANRYAYAGNDPVNNVDPTGTITCSQVSFELGVVAAAASLSLLALPPLGIAAGIATFASISTIGASLTLGYAGTIGRCP